MSNGFEASEHIHRPVDAVWAALTDWERAPEWMAGIESMAVDGGGPSGEGARLVFRARGAERDSTVVAWPPPERVALASRQGGMTAVYEFTCRPEGEGTRVTLNARCEASGLGWRLASPLIGFLMKRADAGQVAALKRVVESRAD